MPHKFGVICLEQIRKLLNDADKSNVTVTDRFDLSGTRFKELYCDGTIALNKDMYIESEKVCVLAEELGHHYTTVGDIMDQTDVSSIAGLIFSCVSSFGILLDIAGIVVGIVGITQKRKKGCAIAGIICGIIGLFLFMVTISDTDSEAIENTQQIISTESTPSTEKSNDSQKKKDKKETQKKKKAKDTEKEFKKSCQKFNYKKIARNPDAYIGQNFKVTVQIYSVSEGGLFTEAYMKAYTDDGSGTYFDNMIYLFDEQDKDSKSYVNILEDDVVTVYGTFEDMEDSTNFLNGEKSKDIALHIKYAKLIKE